MGITLVDGNGSLATTPVAGPLRALDQNKYMGSAGLKYPIDVENYNSYLRFNINLPETSKYNLPQAGAGASSVANANRAAFDPNSSDLNTLSGGTFIAGAAAVGVAQNAGNILQAGLRGGRAAAAGAAVGAAGAGAVQAGVVAAAASQIELTRKTKRLQQAIFLYVPDTINNTMTHQYDAVSLTEALGTAGLALSGINSAGKEIGSLGSENTTFGGGFTPEVLGRLSGATGLTGDLSGLLLRGNGLAINPRIEVLYKSTANREFQFDFKFTPKSPAEMEQVLNIIKAFRFHAAPELGDARYLIPPSEFDIELIGPDGNPNAAFPKYSTCVLEGIDVNYASGGQFAVHRDGTPVEIAMQLRFKEVEILHKKLIEAGF
jgi:Tail-tube assembly protein